MNTLKSRLTNLLGLKRGIFNRIDRETHGRPTINVGIDNAAKPLVAKLQSKQAANDNDSRPDWFQSIHGTDS